MAEGTTTPSDVLALAKDQGALVRHYTKWDDEPRSAAAAVESLTRAWQVAATQPYGPTYVCLDVGLQEAKLEKELRFPDVDRFKPEVVTLIWFGAFGLGAIAFAVALAIQRRAGILQPRTQPVRVGS